jgi:hypothetical protein
MELGVKPSDGTFPTAEQLSEHGFFGFYAHHAKGIGKLQRTLQEQLDEQKLASIFDDLITGNREHDIARLRSLQHEDSKLLLCTLPSKSEYRMSDEVFNGFLNRRLGLPEAPVLPERCKCGNDYRSDSNSHPLRCNKNSGGWIYAHNSGVRALAYCARKAGCLVNTDNLAQQVVLDEADQSADSAKVNIIPDVEIHSSSGTIMCDVSLAISQPSDYRSAVSAGTAATAKRREALKKAKYQPLVDQRQPSCSFFPLVIERDTLAFGPKSLELIDFICAHSRSLSSDDELSVVDVKVRLQLAVCRGTTALIRQALIRDHRVSYRESLRATRRVLCAATAAVSASGAA